MVKNSHIRVAMIGAGAICRSRHLPGLAKLDGVEVVAVSNRSRKSGESVASDFGIPQVVDDWQDLLKRDDVDAVFIGTWPYMHKAMSIAALEAGKHVFCQARMCMNLDEAKDMTAAAEAHPGLVHMICPPPHRMPHEPFIKHVLTDGRLGEITAVTLTSVSGMNVGNDTLHWRENIAYSGRQILAMGILAETLNAWVGPYQALHANLGTFIKTKKDDAGKAVEVKVPQVVTIQGTLANGALCSEYHTGLATHQAHLPGDELIVYGLNGAMRLCMMSSLLEIAEKGGEFKPVTPPAELIRDWQVEPDFIDAVRAAQAGKPWQVSPDFHEGLEYMQKVEAVHVSAETGRTVELASL